jgi:hypothetical protein
VVSIPLLIWSWWRQPRPERRLLDLAHLLVWPFGLLGFLAIMLPWRAGVGYYLIAPAGVFLIGTFLSLYLSLEKFFARGGLLILSLLLLGASGFAAEKLDLWSREHHETGSVVQFLKELLSTSKQNSVAIAMPSPCDEAHNSLGLFMGGAEGILYAKGNRYPETPAGSRKLLVADRYCPGVSVEGFRRDQIIFEAAPWFVYEEMPHPK